MNAASPSNDYADVMLHEGESSDEFQMPVVVQKKASKSFAVNEGASTSFAVNEGPSTSFAPSPPPYVKKVENPSKSLALMTICSPSSQYAPQSTLKKMKPALSHFEPRTYSRFRVGDVVTAKVQYHPMLAQVINPPASKKYDLNPHTYYVKCYGNGACYLVKDSAMKKFNGSFKRPLKTEEKWPNCSEMKSKSEDGSKKSTIDIYDFNDTSSNKDSSSDGDEDVRRKLPWLKFKGWKLPRNPFSRFKEGYKLKIGFIGMGNLSKRLIKRLLLSGLNLTIWKSPREKFSRMSGYCFEWKGTPAEVMIECDITFCCVTNTQTLSKIIHMEGGLLLAISDGKGLVNLTTTDPDVVLDINETIRRNGGRYVGACLLPSVDGGGNGEVIIASGDKCLYSTVFKQLEVMSKAQHYLGTNPMASSKMALVWSSLTGIVLAAFSEQLKFTRPLNLAVEDFHTFVKNSPFGSPFIVNKGANMFRKITPPIMPINHMMNHITLHLARLPTTPLLLTAIVKQNYLEAAAEGDGHGRDDVSTIYRI